MGRQGGPLRGGDFRVATPEGVEETRHVKICVETCLAERREYKAFKMGEIWQIRGIERSPEMPVEKAEQAGLRRVV